MAFVIGSELLSELKLNTVTNKRENCPEGLLQGLLLFCSIYRQIKRKRKLTTLGPKSTMKWIKALGMADYLGFNEWFMDIVQLSHLSLYSLCKNY